MRTKIRLMLSLLLIPFVAIGVLASGTSEESDSEEPIELVYWSHYGQSPDFVHAFADTANKLLPEIGYPNVTVRAEVIEYGGYEGKYLSAFRSGDGPDIFVGSVTDWALNGGKNPVAAPLPDDVAALYDERVGSAWVNEGVFDGERYGFAVEGGSIQLLYYNKDHFRDAGLDPEQPPRTIEEFIEYAEALTVTDEDGEIIRSGHHPRYLSSAIGKFLPFVHQFGGRMLSEDGLTADGYANSTESIAAFQFYADLVHDYEVMNLDFGKPEEAFQRGQTSMVFREGWFAEDTTRRAPDIDFGIAPYITGPEAVVAVSGQPVWANMINEASPHKEIAFELFAAMATREADVMLHQPADYPPILKETNSMDDPYFRTLPYAEAQMQSLEREAAPGYAFPWGPDVWDIYGDAMVTVITTNADPEDVVNEATAQMQQRLDRVNP